MSAKHELLRKTDEEYAGLRAAVGGLDEGQLATVWLGSWGVREIMAHVAGWHREMIPALERLTRGEAPYPDGTYDDFDRWNAKFVDARAGVPGAEILAEVDCSHRDLLKAASGLADEALAPGQTARGLFDGVGPEHYREHAEQIRAWRQGGRP